MVFQKIVRNSTLTGRWWEGRILINLCGKNNVRNCDLLYKACSGPGLREVPVDTFQLSGSRKICISSGNLEDENGKTESYRNTYRGVDLQKMRFVPGGFSCTNSQTSCTWRKVVDGYKRNIVNLLKHHIRFSRVFATLMRPIVRKTECDPLGFQHLLVRPIVFYRTSNSIKTQLIKWK